jgi:hypothetical protein
VHAIHKFLKFIYVSGRLYKYKANCVYTVIICNFCYQIIVNCGSVAVTIIQFLLLYLMWIQTLVLDYLIHVHTQTRARTHTHSLSLTHTHTHTHTHTNTHTHIHTHAENTYTHTTYIRACTHMPHIRTSHLHIRSHYQQCMMNYIH